MSRIPETDIKRRPHSSRRLGDDYQDIVGAGYLLKLITEPEKYVSVEFEKSEAGALDDIVAETSDGYEYVQVKYAVEPGQAWSVDDLVKAQRKRGTCLLAKWARSWVSIREAGRDCAVRIVTNRTPDGTLGGFLNEDASGFLEKALASGDKVAALLLAATGLPKQTAKQFLCELELSFQQPMLEELRQTTKSAFARIGTSDEGWNSFLQALRRWVLYEDPTRVRPGDVRVAARLWNPNGREISQEFPGDASVHIVNTSLLAAVQPRDETASGRYVSLVGPPGAGKSTFLAALADRSAADRNVVECVVRHHCFIDAHDGQHDYRLRAEVAARDICRQLYSAFYPELSASDQSDNVENPTLENLASWLRVCAAAAVARDRQLVLIIDGLDHALDFGDDGELKKLLQALPLPAPTGLYCVLGSQPRSDLLPLRLRQSLADQYTCDGFDENAVRDYATAYLGFEPGEHLTAQLHDASAGNPLHLHYLLRQAPKVGADVSEWVTEVPRYGDGIGDYYGKLWDCLDDSSAVLAVILSELAFPFPQDELSWLLLRAEFSASEAISAIKRVDHLVRRVEGGVQFYHSSFQAFVNDSPDASIFRKTALAAIRDWIGQRADESVQWSYQWEYERRIGDPRPLVEGTTAAWVLESLAAHRPPSRIIDLLSDAITECLNGENLPSAYAKSLLRWKLQEVLDTDGWAGLSRVRETGSLLKGTSQAAPIALAADHVWDLASLVSLARIAAQDGEVDLCRAIFDEVQQRAIRLDSHDQEVLSHLYRAAACADVPPDRVCGHYSRLRNDAPDIAKSAVRAYLHELAELRRTPQILDLCMCDAFVQDEGLAVVDTWCDVALRTRVSSIAWPVQIEELSTGQSSNYAAWNRSIFGHAELNEQVVQGFPENLDDGVPWYGRDANWSVHFEEAFWRSGRLVALGQSARLAEYEKTLADDTRQRARAMEALVQLGKVAARMVTGADWSIAEVCGVVDKLGWPIYWKHDDREFRVLFDRMWVTLLRRAMRLASGVGRQVRLIPADIQRIWRSRGPWPFAVDLIADAANYEWMTKAEIAEVIAWSKARVLVWRDSFPDRAEALASLGVVAAKSGLASEAKDLSHLAVASLLGYGYHKDATLRETLDLLKAINDADIGDSVGMLRRVAPLVEAVQEATDGDGTRYLPVEMFDVLLEVEPSRAPAYLLHLADQQEWYDLGRCMTSFLERADISERDARALGRTCSSEPEFDAFAPRWKTWIDSRCPEEKRQEELQLFNRWYETTRWPSPSTESDTDVTSSSLGEVDTDDLPSDPAALLEMIETDALPQGLGRAEGIGSKIKKWFGESSQAGDSKLLIRLASAWITRRDGFDYQVSDALWSSCMLHGASELAFQLLIKAQKQGRGWTRYWTLREFAESRQDVVLRHFPERALRFVMESLAGSNFAFGLGEPALVVEFLAKAGQREIAEKLAEVHMKLVEAMFPHYPLVYHNWLTIESPPVVADVLFSRLQHPLAAVRVSAARELADSNSPRDTANRLIDAIQVSKNDGECLGPWLALLLLLRHEPAAVDDIEPLKKMWCEGASIVRTLAREALTLVGTDPGLAAIPEAPTALALEAPPEWFMETIQMPQIWGRIEEVPDRHRDTFVAAMCAEAHRLGLSQKNFLDVVEPVRHWNSRDDCYIPHDPRVFELLLGCFSVALDQLAGENGLSAADIEMAAQRAIPFDVTYAAADPRIRPGWLPESRRLERFSYAGQVHGAPVSVPLADWSEAFRSDKGTRLFACDVSVRHDVSAESSVVLPFCYRWMEMDRPDPESVFEYLDEAWSTRQSRSVSEYRDLADQMVGEGPEYPAFMNGLVVFGLVTRYGSRVRRWHALQGYSRPRLLMPGTRFSSDVHGPLVKSDWIYRQSDDSEVARGYFWQSERLEWIHRELGLSGGFVLEVQRDWLDEQLDRLGLRVAWVRKTVLRFVSPNRDRTPREEVTYAFHELSPLIIP